MMIEGKVSEFLRIVGELLSKNPDAEYVWHVSTGPSRNRKQVVPPGAEGLELEDEGLFDRICDLIERVKDEPDKHCWIEVREKAGKRVLSYVHMDISNPDESEPLKTNEAGGIIAAQLIKSNEQLINLLTVKERMVAHLSQKMFDTGLTLRQVETERFMEAQASDDQNLAHAIEALMPMISIALAKWAKMKEPSKSDDASEGPTVASEAVEGLEEGVSPETSPEPDVPDIDNLLDQIEFVLEHHSEELTQERINRIFNAFTSSQ